jgi:hypothetical protein
MRDANPLRVVLNAPALYVATTQSGSTLTPDPLTLPGRSGANMTCQLVYRDTSEAIHYGTPVSSGACSIPVSNVKNGGGGAVISNTDYTYDGGTTKYGHTLTLDSSVTGTADIYTQWHR